MTDSARFCSQLHGGKPKITQLNLHRAVPESVKGTEEAIKSIKAETA